IHAAEDALAGGVGVDVGAAAKQRFFPSLPSDLVVVLDIGIFDADDGETIRALLEGVEATVVPALIAAATLAAFLPLAESSGCFREGDFHFAVLGFLFLRLDENGEDVAGFVVRENGGDRDAVSECL